MNICASIKFQRITNELKDVIEHVKLVKCLNFIATISLTESGNRYIYEMLYTAFNCTNGNCSFCPLFAELCNEKQ